MTGAEYFVSFQMSFFLTEEYNIMVNSEELIGATISDSINAGDHVNRCRYNRVLP
jgi:hypothetical protein